MIDFPMVQDQASLLWVVNLGCIDLNPWYARCDDVDRPDYLHFDLDPLEGSSFRLVREAALIVRDSLAELKIKSYGKTTGSRGIHVYVGIVANAKTGMGVCEGVFNPACQEASESERRSIAWRSGRVGACWSTTIKMPGTGRSRLSTR